MNGDAERAVEGLYAAYDWSAVDPPPAVHMALDALGGDCFEWGPTDGPEATVSYQGGRVTLRLRRGVTAPRANYLAAYHLLARALPGVHPTRAATAAAVCLPRVAVYARHDRSAREIATELTLPGALVALRLAEVLGTPTAVVSGGYAIVRGRETAALPRCEAGRAALARGVVRPLRARVEQLESGAVAITAA